MSNTVCEYWVKVGDSLTEGICSLQDAMELAIDQHDTTHKAVSFGHYRWGQPITTAAWTARG